MQQHRTYRTLKKRVARTAPGRWLRRIRQARRDRALQLQRARDAVIFIVAQKDFPYANAQYMYREWLEWAAVNEPELHARIRLSHLPAELPAEATVLHAWVQDPVRERDEVLYQQLGALESSALHAGANVIHPARILSNSRRDVQFERLSRVGLRTPRVVDVDAGFADGFGGLSLPVVVRKSWGHCARLTRLDSDAQVAEWLGELGPSPQDWVATEYIDVRSADGYYRKYRYVLFGERGVCRHLIVSSDWEVRPKDRVLTDETIAEELRFVGAHCAEHDILDAGRRELEFDIAAFDSNGEIVVWEANPFPDLSTPRGRPGEYLGESILRTNRALAGLYHDRLAAAR
jgi:hypothetical protein